MRTVGNLSAPSTADDTWAVIVYRRDGMGFGPLWDAISAHDDAETDRISTRLLDPSEFSARGLGD
ncbi:hypothetical protein [Streptomyces sp. NPDC001108]